MDPSNKSGLISLTENLAKAKRAASISGSMLNPLEMLQEVFFAASYSLAAQAS